jgi:hypothetical protein
MIDLSLVFDGTFTTDPPTGVAITATATSTNIIDWLTGRDVGAGEPLGIHVLISGAFVTTNSATLQINYQVCDTTNGTYLTILSSPVYPAAQLIKGAPLFRYALPVNQILNATAGVLKTPGRYCQLQYVVGTGVFSSTSAIVAFLTPRQDRNEYYNYPIGYTAAVQSGQI